MIYTVKMTAMKDEDGLEYLKNEFVSDVNTEKVTVR